jgi:hypothetical protein
VIPGPGPTAAEALAVKTTDLQLLYGKAGAREKFENLVTQLEKSE